MIKEFSSLKHLLFENLKVLVNAELIQYEGREASDTPSNSVLQQRNYGMKHKIAPTFLLPGYNDSSGTFES